MEKAGPVLPSGRIHDLDFIRGIALIGILTVNMSMFFSPYFYADMLGTEQWSSSVDQWVDQWIHILAQGKFYTMFSFLFGFGAVLFLEKAEGKHFSPNSLFIRRMFGLLLFGIIHVVFLWYGDILVAYSLTGFLLLAFMSSHAKTMVIWACSLISSYIILLFLIIWGASSLPETEMNQDWAEDRYAASFEMYGSGTYVESLMFRFEELGFLFSNSILIILFFVLPMFLFGAAAAKQREYFYTLGILKMKRFMLWMFLIGAAFTGVKQWSERGMNPIHLSMYDFWNALGMAIGDISLCFFYIVLFYYIYQRTQEFWLTGKIRLLGRMALTNYIMQSVICTTLFYGYGFGLYGEIGPATGVMITLLIIVVQLGLSHLWLRRFRFGPLEWFWRLLTYGKVMKTESTDRGR